MSFSSLSILLQYKAQAVTAPSSFFFSFHTDQIKLINFQFYLKDFF